jgi:hypothetical protein
MSISLLPYEWTTRNHPVAVGDNKFLLANAGQQVTDKTRLLFTFDFKSSADEPVQVNDQYSFKAIGFDWGDKGFLIGDTVNVNYDINNGAATALNLSVTIADIQGDLIIFTSIVVAPGFEGSLLPLSAGSDVNTPLILNNDSTELPEQIEIYHNIINNTSSANKNSLLDGEQNRFLANDVEAMAVGSTVEMIQMGNKSGGSYIWAGLYRDTNYADGRKNFLVSFIYYTPWKFESQSFNKVSYLTGAQSLKPCYFIKAYPEQNNPNAGLEIDGYGYNHGNAGGYKESYNGGTDNFTLSDLTITDSSGQIINEIDHNQTCTVTGKVTGISPMKDFIEGEFYIIPPEEDFKNNENSNAENIFLSSFTAELAGVVDSDFYGKNGGLVNSSNEIITSISGNDLLFSFELAPNAAFTSYINALQEQDRLYRISLNVESDGGTDNDNDSVSKILKEGILTAAPIPDALYDDVVSSGFYNHWQDIGTGLSASTYNGCTEDDFVYKTIFNLDKSELWEQMNISVEVVKDSDGSSFILDSKTFNFNSFTMDSDGVIQFSGAKSTQVIQQFLEAPERNKIQIQNTGVTTAGTYEVELNWSIMANWRYWEQQSNAFLEFFDTSLPNEGKNKEWVRYLSVSGFSIKLFSRLVKDSISYYWVNPIVLDEYDAEATITSLDPVYIDDQGVVQTVLVSGQDMTVRADHVLSDGDWDVNDTVGWISERGFENDPNKRISTFWNWTSQSSPLKPKTGLTRCELTFPSPNIARCESLVDTSLTDIDNISFISRIQSPIVTISFRPFIYSIEIPAENDYLVSIPTRSGLNYNYVVDWGDDTIEPITGDGTSNPTHYYNTGTASPITDFIIKIYYEFPTIYFNDSSAVDEVTDIIQFGDVIWGSFVRSYEGLGAKLSNGNISATDAPILTDVNSFSYAFKDSTLENPDFSGWDVSNISFFIEMFSSSPLFNGDVTTWNTESATDFNGMFLYAESFNKDIGGWNTALATNFKNMFNNATVFNQDIGAWNTESGTDFSSMFANATAFNQDIGAWNTALATDFSSMFYNATDFNKDIGGWNTALATKFNNMFLNAIAFNQDIGAWNTALATDFSNMFTNAKVFNQDIGAWNTALATDFSNMFLIAIAFNQDIGAWNTESGTKFNNMFNQTPFNQDIGAWNTESATDFSNMFYATPFNQDIGAWNTESATDFSGMFAGATAFNQNLGAWNFGAGLTDLTTIFNNSGMSTANYTDTIVGWANNIFDNAGSPSTVDMSNQFSMTFDTSRGGGANFTTAGDARDYLTTTLSWTIDGDTII